MEQFKGTIYQAINIQNNKSYIGKTLQNFEEYREDHVQNAINGNDFKQIKNGKYFYNAVRKYGPQNFKWVILGEVFAETKQELKKLLNEAEIECIWLFKTFGSNGEKFDNIYGYNKTPGGDGGYALDGHPNEKEILKRRGLSLSRTLQKNPDISVKRVIKRKLTLISNPLISVKQKEKEIITKKNNPSIMQNAGRNGGETRTKNRSEVGKNNPRYVEINYSFLIINYFNIIGKKDIIILYNNSLDEKIKDESYMRFLRILNFPTNRISVRSGPKKKIYLKFVEENKHKIDWYVENYERLEEEYFEKRALLSDKRYP